MAEVVEPLITRADVDALLSKLVGVINNDLIEKIVVPVNIDKRIDNFNERLNLISVVPDNNIRILADLTHDIGGRVGYDINVTPPTYGKNNIIKYLIDNSNAYKNNSKKASVYEKIDSFLRRQNPDKPDEPRTANEINILAWFDRDSNIDDYEYIPDSEGEYMEKFRAYLERQGCNTIILDSFNSNPIEYHFKNSQAGEEVKWIYLNSSVCNTDAGSKIGQAKIEQYNMSFINELSPFNVLKFFNSRKHTFSYDDRTGFGTIQCLSKEATILLETSIKGGFSVDGLCKKIGFGVPRNGANPNQPIIKGVPFDEKKKAELLLIKTITDYSQVYYAAFLYHILNIKTLFITNDRFCLRIAKLFELPYVLRSISREKNKGYIFAPDARLVNDTQIANIINKFKYYITNDENIKLITNTKYNEIETYLINKYDSTVLVEDIIAIDIKLQAIESIKIKYIHIFEEFNEIIVDLNKKGVFSDGFNVSTLTPAEKIKIQTYVNLLKLNNDNDSFSTYFINKDREIELINAEIDTISSRIKLRSQAVIDTDTLKNFMTIFDELLSSTKKLQFTPTIKPFLLALIFFGRPYLYQFFFELYFTEPVGMPAGNYELQINEFRILARYMYVLYIMLASNEGILKVLFSKITNISAITNKLKSILPDILPISYFINMNVNIDVPTVPVGEVPKIIAKKVMSSLYNVSRENFMNARPKVEENKKAIEMYADFYNASILTEGPYIPYFFIPNLLINDKISRILEKDVNSILVGTDLNKLKGLRKELFDKILKNEPVANSKPPYRDYYLVAYIDNKIASLEPIPPHTDYLVRSIHLLNIYIITKTIKRFDAPFHRSVNYLVGLINMIKPGGISLKSNFIVQAPVAAVAVGPEAPVAVAPVAPVAVAPVAVASGKKRGRQPNATGETENNEAVEPAAKRPAKGGGNNNSNNKQIIIDKITKEEEEKMMKIINYYITKYTTDAKKYFYKPSISSDYLDTYLQNLITQSNSIFSSSMTQNVLKATLESWYDDVYNILNILLDDAKESNEGEDFQDILNKLIIFKQQYINQINNITTNDLILYIINTVVNNTIVEKYFFNLFDLQKQILPLLMVFNSIYTKVLPYSQQIPIPSSYPIPIAKPTQYTANQQKLAQLYAYHQQQILEQQIREHPELAAYYQQQQHSSYMQPFSTHTQTVPAYGGRRLLKTTRKKHKKTKVTRRNYKNQKTKKRGKKNLKRKTRKA